MISYENLQKILLLEMEDDLLNAVDTYDNVDTNGPRISPDRDTTNKINKIFRPQGIIIEDTWNNCVFPIQPHPQIDTSRFDMIVVMKRFRELYLNFPSDFLPWHYMIEMIGSRYYIFQTRPLDTKFPFSNQDIIDAKHDFKDDVTKRFFEDKIYQINNMIHVCLIGDSNLDIYPQKLYKLIGRTCIYPLYQNGRNIKNSVDNSVIGLNLGRKFNIKTLKAFSKK